MGGKEGEVKKFHHFGAKSSELIRFTTGFTRGHEKSGSFGAGFILKNEVGIFEKTQEGTVRFDLTRDPKDRNYS
ncbi:MAG: hypothetical protein C0433_19445 [Cyclobacterium sp.]|nr:hypothetical protein [Cyclobacterium sp.]